MRARNFKWVFQDQLEYEGTPSLRSNCACVMRAVVVVRHMSTLLFRLSQLAGRRSSLTAHALKQVNHVLTGADIAWQAQVAPGLVLHHPTGVVVGAEVRVGPRCRIQQGVTLGGSGGTDDGSPEIGSSVVLGAGSRVLGRLTVGDDVVVGANAVVLTSIPAHSIAVGVPATARKKNS